MFIKIVLVGKVESDLRLKLSIYFSFVRKTE